MLFISTTDASRLAIWQEEPLCLGSTPLPQPQPTTNQEEAFELKLDGVCYTNTCEVPSR